MNGIAQTVEQQPVVTASSRRQCPLRLKVGGAIPSVVRFQSDGEVK